MEKTKGGEGTRVASTAVNPGGATGASHSDNSTWYVDCVLDFGQGESV